MKMNRAMRRGKWPFNPGMTKQVVNAVDNAAELTDEQRDRMLRDLDEIEARRVFPMLSAEAILPMLHKVRYEVTSMSDEHRHESRAWLEEHGHPRMRGLPWPPKGELEK